MKLSLNHKESTAKSNAEKNRINVDALKIRKQVHINIDDNKTLFQQVYTPDVSAKF